MVDDFIIKVFEGQEIDFIERENKIWITARAIAKGLGIHKDNILQIYYNNKDLLNPYSTTMKISSPQGTQQNTRVFDKVGFIGICMRSKSPRALPFQQWTLNIIEEIENKGYYISDKFLRDYANNRIMELLKDLFRKQERHISFFKNAKEEFKLIKSELNEIDEKLQVIENKKNLKSIIESEEKSNLKLIIKRLQQLPSITAKELTKELNMSRSTIYNYLNELQTQNLIEFDFLKTKTRGRPVKKYKLSYIS